MRAILRADRGSGFPILYVPGIDGTGELLLGTASRLEQHYRLLRLTYRSDDDVSADTYRELAGSVAQICREQGVQRCLVLAESFGGAVAIQLALDYPELVQCLMIVNSFAHFPQSKRLGLSRKISAWIPRTLFDFARRTLAPHALFGALKDPDALRAFRELPGAFFDEGYRRRMKMISQLDLRDRLGELALPVMLVASDQDRVVPSFLTMDQIAQDVPQATLETVVGGGHLILPLAQQPWLERIESLLARK